ncbi:MAG: putative bifunctional diguanylate cyclase/phosphodiesterase [Allosphingosinicella sp.]
MRSSSGRPVEGARRGIGDRDVRVGSAALSMFPGPDRPNAGGAAVPLVPVPRRMPAMGLGAIAVQGDDDEACQSARAARFRWMRWPLATWRTGLVCDAGAAPGVDRLTGLLNRYGLIEWLETLEPQPASVLMIVKLDILCFHDVNSGFGYGAGDALLRSVAQRLVSLPAAAVARVGTHTFALAFELEEDGRPAGVIDDVLALLKPRFVLPETSVVVRFAAGYALGSAGANPLRLVRQAGVALQRARATPPHRPQAFAAADERDARNRIRLASELQTAVINHELLFHYQPQFDLRSGRLVGAEALLRWDHGVFGMQPPARFIGIAEETGAILEIGAWGLRALAAHAERVNRDRRAPIRFAFNTSVIEFTQRDMVALVRQVLDETGCRAEWLTLELTENLMVGEPDYVRRVLGELRRLGIGISIDDFGTGYSNLRYLESFPLTEIKIDRSFVRDVAHSATKRVIVESVVKLGAALDIRIVAEGIETDSERAIMQALGCSTGQGYLFAVPMEEPDLHRVLEQELELNAGWDARPFLTMLDRGGMLARPCLGGEHAPSAL